MRYHAVMRGFDKGNGGIDTCFFKMVLVRLRGFESCLFALNVSCIILHTGYISLKAVDDCFMFILPRTALQLFNSSLTLWREERGIEECRTLKISYGSCSSSNLSLGWTNSYSRVVILCPFLLTVGFCSLCSRGWFCLCLSMVWIVSILIPPVPNRKIGFCTEFSEIAYPFSILASS